MDDHEYAERLRVTMSELTAEFHRPADLATTLSRITETAVELIDGVEYADVLLISGDESFESVAATGRVASDLGAVQRSCREGPCLSAAVDDVVTLSNDLGSETRWPQFARSATAAGVHGMLSFRLYTHDARQGAMNFFATKPHAFTAEKEALAAMLATQAAIALIADDRDLQFRSALASRDLIGQAKGMIMERFDVDALRAFDLLKRLSQEANIRLVEIAAEIVSRGPEPTGG